MVNHTVRFIRYDSVNKLKLLSQRSILKLKTSTFRKKFENVQISFKKVILWFVPVSDFTGLTQLKKIERIKKHVNQSFVISLKISKIRNSRSDGDKGPYAKRRPCGLKEDIQHTIYLG